MRIHFFPTVKRLSVVLVAMVLVVGFATCSFAALEYPHNYRGIRPLGMGGAFTAISDDENALFYNPAGLSRIDTLSMGILNPLVGVSENAIDFYQDLKDANMDDTGEATALLRKYVGEHLHLGAQWIPFVGFNVANAGVMVAGIASANANAEVRNPAYPRLNIKGNADYGFTGGAGFKLPFKGVRVGATVKYIDRESLDQEYTAADIADDKFEDRFDDDRKSGSGMSMDIGLLYELPIESAVTHTVGLSVNNLFEMDMDEAEDIKRTINLGYAAEYPISGFTLIGAFDILDITRNYEQDDDYMKRIHMGAELQFPMILSLRMGLYQGYLSAGATVDFKFFQLDFASYTEEVGAYAGQRDDQRYLGQISFGW